MKTGTKRSITIIGTAVALFGIFGVIPAFADDCRDNDRRDIRVVQPECVAPGYSARGGEISRFDLRKVAEQHERMDRSDSHRDDRR